MSGIALACHIRYRKMVRARSESAKHRAEINQKHEDFK